MGMWLWPRQKGGGTVGKHDDHAAKTTGDGQVPKGTLIPPPPRDEGRHHQNDGGERGDQDEDDNNQDTR